MREHGNLGQKMAVGLVYRCFVAAVLLTGAVSLVPDNNTAYLTSHPVCEASKPTVVLSVNWHMLSGSATAHASWGKLSELTRTVAAGDGAQASHHIVRWATDRASVDPLLLLDQAPRAAHKRCGR
jgi:hypothetical protein